MLRDIDWCLGDAEVLDKFPGQVVAVHRRRVWGAGTDMTTAFDNAAKNEGCPTIDQIAFVVIPEKVFWDWDDLGPKARRRMAPAGNE